MSLLLDALKKAAQEKQNADATDADTETPAEETLLETSAKDSSVDEPSSVTEQPAELELDDESLAVMEESHQSEAATPVLQPQPRVTATPSTVSDEALQLLIRKSNEGHKKSSRIIWGSVTTAAVVILLLGGAYFYSGMTDEIESMQRKHQIALASLKSKTRIEENLTSLAVQPEKTVDAVSNTQADSATTVAKKQASTNSQSSKPVSKTLSVERVEKRDPVSVDLDRAWSAYQRQDYDVARTGYEKVLAVEPANHDANLGVAAVALKTGDLETARDIYIQLLERDPRDPHAHSGLANIAQSGGASLSESKLKQLIEHRPEDSHLQFALGNLYVQKQNWPGAQQAFFNAWKNDTQNADYAYNLAVSLDHLGKHREALSYYRDSLKLANGKNINFSQDAVRSRVAYLGSRQSP